MKKWVVLLLVILTLTISSIYIFIPATIVISGLSKSETSSEGEYRIISDESKWHKWWRDAEGKKHIAGNPFLYNGSRFKITKTGNNAVGIEVDRNGEKNEVLIHLITFSDSIGAIWRCELPFSNNPFNRIKNYKRAVEIYRDMNGIMKIFSTFASNPQNVYGFTFF